jgi:CBS domain-containing protein
MKVEKIMTREVISVTPETPLKEVARLLVANRISGVPVVGPDGEVLGVVSEADILRKEEGVDPELPRPLAWLARKLDGELDKIGAVTAGEAMTAPAYTVRPGQMTTEVARRMVDSMINRVPVVSDGVLVGIVSRADLVRAFIRSDEEIEHDVREGVLLHELLLNPGEVTVSVENGLVSLAGQVGSQEDAEVLERRVRAIPGVVGIAANLHWRPRDTRQAPTAYGLP